LSDPTRPRRAAAPDGLLILGLVGRAGSGKSSVARALAARGAIVLEADRIGHEVTDSDAEVRAGLLARYGPAVYQDDGTLNRHLVATLVFTNPAALAELNQLVHPRILHRLRARLAALAAEAFRGPVVVDAALMLDWGFERECDGVIAVTAPEEARVARLVAARGWTEAEARRRLAAQKPDAYFIAAADEVIENAGSQAELAAAVDAALERLRSRTAGRL
jgi:dephospho-CoA kinase